MIIRTKNNLFLGQPPGVHLAGSTNAAKLHRYGQESYYQESTRCLSEGLEGELLNYGGFTFVILKPDAFVARAGRRILKSLYRRGFSVLSCVPFEFSRHMWRELWRYELNVARFERYELIDELLCRGPSLFLLIKDVTGSLDASLRLSSLKGSTDDSKRANASIRSEVQAGKGTLNFIHTPDEFIDFIRECGVLFDRSTLFELASAMNSQSSIEAEHHISKLEALYPEQDLSLDVVVSRRSRGFAETLEAHVEQLRKNPHLLKADLCKKFNLTEWEWIIIASHFLEYSYPNIPRVLDFEGVSQ